MTEKEKIEAVQEFIYSDEIQGKLEEINNLLLTINVLEVTGMGYQEIKHSNVLAWIFGDNSHQLDYEILAKFLGKITRKGGANEGKNKLKELRHYAFFSKSRRNIQIYREYPINLSDEKNASNKRARCSIDLLIIDDSNECIIAIENKIWSQEGDSQLSDYQKAIEMKFGKNTVHENFQKHFIYLTPKVGMPDSISSDEDWLVADYQTLYVIIDKIIKNKNRDIPNEAKFILQSYNDLLIKESIVSNNDLQNLCAKIWRNKEHKEALNILLENKPDNINKIASIINDRLTEEILGFLLVANQNTKTIFKFTTASIQKQYEGKQQQFYYHLAITDKGLYLDLNIRNVQDKLIEQLVNSNIIKKGKESRQIANENIDNWNDIKYTPIDNNEDLPHQGYFLDKLNEVIKKLKAYDKKIESAIQQCK